MIGSIASVLERDEKISPQLEGLMVSHVFPEANSPAHFLRARVPSPSSSSSPSSSFLSLFFFEKKKSLSFENGIRHVGASINLMRLPGHRKMYLLFYFKPLFFSLLAKPEHLHLDNRMLLKPFKLFPNV